jgi:very-short-patch-repair endonuclease
MGQKRVQWDAESAWMLADRQHGVVCRAQLLELGLSSDSIHHRLTNGRLHAIHAGVYAVGRPRITRQAAWMAAVLACGPQAVLSHASAGALWGVCPPRGPIEVSVPANKHPRVPRIRVHRRSSLAEDLARRHGIPVTSPTRTLIDLSTQLSPSQIERAINEADKLDLVDPESLRSALEQRRGQRGVRALREILDRATFILTDSELERRFLRIIRRAGLAEPLTQQAVNGFRVDFFWPDLGLVVETDGLRYHRTPTQQQSDRIRDQAHAKAGLTPLRFTHAQVAFESSQVEAVLGSVASRLGAGQMRL